MATYYISKVDGSDSYNGTAPAYVSGTTGPWLTLAKAVSTISSGDTVQLRGGTWQDEQLNISYKNYASTTTFKAYSGETPVIDMRNSGTGTGAKGIYLDSSNYVYIDGITVRNSGHKAINAEDSDNLTIINCTTEHSRLSGIYISGCNDFSVSYNDVKWTQCMAADHDHPQWTSSSEECISIAESSTNGEIHHCTISHGTTGYGGGEGLNIKNGCSYIYVHHNTVDQARDDSVESTRYCAGVDGWTTETHHIYFYNNIIKNGSWGLQYNSEEGGYTHHIYGWNNLIYHIGHSSNQRGGGIGFPPYGNGPGICDYCYWWNNTIYDCYYGFKGDKEELGTGENYIQNNIISGTVSTDVYFAASDEADVTLDHNLMSTDDPDFIDPPDDFHIGADSDAIDAGTTLSFPVGDNVDYDDVARPQGANYDIGAYEYEDSGVSITSIPDAIITEAEIVDPTIIALLMGGLNKYGVILRMK